MPLIAISASYGAGGSEIGPQLAQRLEVPFLDRSIPAAVAERLAVPLAQALEHDQSVSSTLDRLLRGFALAGTGLSVYPIPTEAITDESHIEATEQVIHEQAAAGAAVILGRAAGIVLRDDGRVLRVRLDGPPEQRIVQAMRIQDVDRATAERRMHETDRAREAYLKHFYGVDVHDPTLYHLVVDSTAATFDACVEIIALASDSFPHST